MPWPQTVTQVPTHTTDSTAPQGVTLHFYCGLCLDRGAVKRPWMRFGNFVVMQWERCPACNSSTGERY